MPHACSVPSPSVSLYSISAAILFATKHYFEETNEDNKDILRQFLYEKWNQTSENQKLHLRESVGSGDLLISDFEKIRRIINKETLSDEENFEFIFNSFISGEIRHLQSVLEMIGFFQKVYQTAGGKVEEAGGKVEEAGGNNDEVPFDLLYNNTDKIDSVEKKP